MRVPRCESGGDGLIDGLEGGIGEPLDESFEGAPFAAAPDALPDGALPPADTIAGRFILDMEARIVASEKEGNVAAAAEARAALRLGRRLLDDPRLVTLA